LKPFCQHDSISQGKVGYRDGCWQRSVTSRLIDKTLTSPGINLEFARILLKNGANVVIGDLSLRPEAQKLVDEYSSGDGPKALFVKTDVTSWSDLNNLFQAAEKEFSTYDIVCPGAGVFEPPFSSFWFGLNSIHLPSTYS
jgi:NAD(P)-dependent dehydrogenase (short-subunit alcohol dehydrogenase family)